MVNVTLATYDGASLTTIGSIDVDEADWPDEVSQKGYTALLNGSHNAPENNVEALLNEDGFVLEPDFYGLGRIIEDARIREQYA